MKFELNKNKEKILGHVFLMSEQVGSFQVGKLPYTQVVFKLPSGIYFNAYGEKLELVKEEAK